MPAGFPTKFLAFCSRAPVLKHMPPATQMARSGVAWGRPSGAQRELLRSTQGVDRVGPRANVRIGPRKGPRSARGSMESKSVMLLRLAYQLRLIAFVALLQRLRPTRQTTPKLM